MRHFIEEVDDPRRTQETLICISQLGELKSRDEVWKNGNSPLVTFFAAISVVA